MILRFDGTQVVFLVFESGKLVVTGSKTMREAEDSYEMIKSVLTDVYADSPPR